MRDPRQFDSADFYIGISILLFATGHQIGGTVSLIIGIFIWIMFKIYSKYIQKIQKKNIITEEKK